MVMQIVVFRYSYDYLNSFAFSPDNDDDDDEYDNGQSLHEREIVGKKNNKRINPKLFMKKKR